MSREMKFQGEDVGCTVEVSGPDSGDEYRITVEESDGHYGYLYVSRATLAEIHAFIGALLAGDVA